MSYSIEENNAGRNNVNDVPENEGTPENGDHMADEGASLVIPMNLFPEQFADRFKAIEDNQQLILGNQKLADERYNRFEDIHEELERFDAIDDCKSRCVW